ncbi:uncharacterized protein LOC124167657 [Ischnura elegans]|uniref:uncharacterized protein LOC124167657 n=1 Tax=Ischnura elegans TaxID=197161 RepID=UPI001ED88DDE|nr:uncharacterized protein LOC124167657 [Ischnura elegans]
MKVYFLFVAAWALPGPGLPAAEAASANDGVGLVVSSCGTVTTAPKGVLQTPGFPKAFPVPLKCTWVIDDSAGHAPGSSILVRLTQVFVTGGLRFESFARLDVSPVFDGRPWRFSGGHGTHGRLPSDGRQLIFDSDFGSSPPLEEVAWIRSASPYLVATLAIDTLEGSHIRDLGVLLDVYGLNMTFEVLPPPSAKGNPMDLGALGGRRRQGGKRRGGKDEDLDGGCSLLGCSVAGHCLANHDLSRYHCSCFEGHFGRRCQYSRECNPMKNVTRCYNGGKCRHVGSTAIRCQCPKGFYGPLCESDHPSTGVKNHNSIVGGRDPGRRQKTKVKGSAVLRETKGCPNCQSFLCNYNGSHGSACQCQNKYKVNKGDRWLFEVKFKIANISAKTPVFQNVTLNELLEQQITTFLKSQNVTSEPRVSIEDVSDNGEVSYSFRVGEEDGPKAREAMGVLVREKKHLGELLIASDSLELHEEPALLLLKVALDTANVAPGGGYTASCVAQGSPAMEFRWYKDGYLIDHTKASRHMWQRLLLDGRPNTYTAILRVTEVSVPEDMGVLWCHVSDRGRQQCGHVLIVESRGEHQQVIVQPRASTIHRGDNLTLACTSPSSVTNGNSNRVAYFLWRKNGSPLNTTVAKEVVEPLYPTGSLLRIYNAQKSAEYTCHIATNLSFQESSLHLKQPQTPLSWEGKIGHSSHVTVVHPGDPLCPRETSWGAAWPYTAVGQRAAVECPVGLSANFPKPLNGHGGANIPPNGTEWGLLPSNNVWVPLHGGTSEATRLCGATAKWEVPNFSNCYFHPVSFLLKNFQKLTHGYLTTSPEETLQEILDWLMSEDAWTIPKNTTSSNSLRDLQGPHSPKSAILLPGQIQQLLQLLEEIQFYLHNRMVVKDSSHGDIDMHISSHRLLKILDLLLFEYQDSFSNPKISSRFIHLALRQSTLWVYSLGVEFSVQYPSMASNVTVPDLSTTSMSLFALVDSLAYGRMRIPMPDVSTPAWFSDQVEVSLVARSEKDPVSNVTGGLSVNMFSNPGASTIIPDELTKNILLSIVTFKNIGSNIPIKNQNRYHQMEYQLASHVISINVYHKHEQKPHRSSMKSFLKNNEDWKKWDTSFRAEIPFNIALNFSIKPQRILRQFEDGHDYLVACGQLTDEQVATTAELTSFWDVGISHSPSGSVVTCNFEHSGTFAAFIIGHKLKSSKNKEPSGLTSKYADSEERISADDDWWKALNGGHRNEGRTILITGFSTCFTLCLFTILINLMAIILPWREVQKKCPGDLPQVRRSSSSEQHVCERDFNHAHVVISKKIVAKWNGDSVSVELYLQIQCCVAILILMGLFSYCCLIISPQSYFLAMALALEGSMLTGMGSLMGIVLILYCDISNETKVRQVASQACTTIIRVRNCGEQGTTAVASSVTPSKKDSSLQGWQFICCKMAKLQNFLQSKLFIAGITSGIPVLSLMFCALLQRIFSSKKHSSWWLTIESPDCVIFICLGIIMSILFLPVSICMMWQLHKNETQTEMLVDEFARRKEAEVNTITSRRIEVLRRALVIFSLIAIMEITSILYINFPDSSVIQWIFSISSLCLGMAIFLSYAIKLDEPKKVCNNLLFSILSLVRHRR